MGRKIFAVSILVSTLIACESTGSRTGEHASAKTQRPGVGTGPAAGLATPQPVREAAPAPDAAANSGNEADSNADEGTTPREPIYLPTPVVPFRIVSVDLGREIADDNAISEPTSVFQPKDTVYASVATEGQAFEKNLEAHWTFESGEPLADDARAISSDGPARLAFQVAHPGAWPVGKYKLEMRVDGEATDSREFQVK